MLFTYEGMESKAPLCPHFRTSCEVVPRAPAWEGGYGEEPLGKAGFGIPVPHTSACEGCWTGFIMGVVELNTFSFHQ